MRNFEELHKKRKAHQIDDVDDRSSNCWEQLPNGPLVEIAEQIDDRWEQLPNGPLVEIAEQLTNFEDFEALHLVCHSWNSALRASHCKFLAGGGHVAHCTFQVPWLLIAGQEREAESNVSCPLKPCSSSTKSKSNAVRLFFYRLSFDRVHQMPLRLPPQLDIDQRNFNYSTLLSSHGWLFVVTEGLAMSLYNPLCGSTHNYIPLPRNDTLATRALRFSLSACPCTNTYTVMLAFNDLAFWSPGDEDWTVVKPFSTSIGYLLDVTFYKGHFIAVDNCGQVYMIYNEEGHGEKKKFRFSNFATLFPDRTYRYLWKAYFVLVESSQKLLLVVRDPLQPKIQPIFVTNRDHLTVGFRVMEICVPPTPIVDIMDEDREQPLKEVNNLGNISLFVGRNQAFAVEVPHSENGVNVSPSYYGCKPNCIYFTDDRLLSRRATEDCDKGKGKDMGVYSMADGSIARHFEGESLGDYSPMLWV